MKSIVKSVLLFLGALFIFTSCEEMMSDVNIPSSVPKLVITGYLSTSDDTISIIVQKSRPLYVPSTAGGNPYPSVTNALVTISDGSNTVTLPYDTFTGNYRIPATVMPVLAGTSYFLSVTTPDGNSATSSCRVPQGTAPEVEITGIDTINQNGGILKKVSFRFIDLPGSGQFYGISAGSYYGYENDPNPAFYPIDFEHGDLFVSDKNKEGEYFTYRTKEIDEYRTNSNLYISLLITDENYFNFHRSLNSFQGDNPFAEPTTIFTNIQGGLGVFAGVNGKVSEFQIGSK
jgi:hypothetical protein